MLLIESMAQAGVVGLGIYLLARESSPEEAAGLITVFSDATVEFNAPVQPGDRVLISGRKVFFRRRKLRARVAMRLEDGTLVCSGELSGVGVPR